jgi:hypothetical protein
MNLIDAIDIIEPYYELLFPIIVMILSFLVWRAVRSFWSQNTDNSQMYQFRRGDSEYQDPVRSYSKSFSNYMQLALIPTANNQLALVVKLSELLNENFQVKLIVSETVLSPSLSLILEDPERWLKKIREKNPSEGRNRRKQTSKILSEEILKILTEVDSLYNIQLFPKLE